MNSKQFESILVTCWISGGKPDQRLARRFGVAVGELHDTFRDEVDRRLSAGEMSIEKGERGELVVYRHPADGTLRDIVEPYLDAPDVPDNTKAMLKGALRSYFDLAGTCTRGDFLRAAEAVSLRDAYRVPEEAYEKRAAESASKVALHYRSALRAAMEWAALRFPVPVVLPAEWCRLDSDVTRRTLHALAELWASGKEPSAAALREAGGPNPASVQRRLHEWERLGGAAFRAHEKTGRTLLWINRSQLDIEAASLADGIAAYLDAPESSGRQQREVLSALRTHFGLENYSPRPQVLAACGEVPCRELHGFASVVQRSLVKRGLSRKRARTMASAIRVALRWAAAQGRIPIHFENRLEDPWVRAKNRWIPVRKGTIDGASRASRHRYRSDWALLGVAIRDLYGPEVDPHSITAEMTDAAMILLKKRGRYDRARGISGMLNWLGRRGLGPRAGTVAPYDGDPLLKGAGGDGCATYERFLAALDANDLPPQWRTFFEWYSDYSTLSWDQLAAQEENGVRRFPDRAPVRKLGSATLHSRTKAVRWLLGISKDFLGTDLSTLALETAFSEQYLRRVFAEGQRLHMLRYEAGELTSPYGTSLHQYVTGLGLVAESLYHLGRHQAGDEVAVETSRNRRRGVVALDEEATTKTIQQERLWRGYLHSRQVAGILKEQAEEFGTAANRNTVKDLARIIRITPPDWYWDVHQAALELARRSLAEDGSSQDHHLLIRDVYVWCLLLSTGMRGHELANVRIDLQYPEHERSKGAGDRFIKLRKQDRKNARAHTCVVRDLFVPGWLEAAFLDASRPWLMRTLAMTNARWGLRRGQMHHHLIVDNHGQALGCVAEREDGRGRDDRAMESRVSWLRDVVKNRFGRIAWDICGRECPSRDSEFTLHTIRNVVGYFLYQRAKRSGDEHPAIAAANYLGDDPSMVQDVYGGIDGSLVLSASFERMSDWRYLGTRANGSGAPPAATPAVSRSVLELLRDARAEVEAEAATLGLDEREVELVWADRKRRVLADRSDSEAA
jgi:integrase